MNIAPASLIFVALSSSALAQAAVGLAYEAPDGCPSEREFVDAVATRGADFEGAATNGVHRVMLVAIRKQGDRFAGVFQVRDGEAATNKREVQGTSCSEVVDALAVVTAIALRPERTTPAAPSASATVPVPPPPVEAPVPPAGASLRGTSFVRRHAHESVTVPAGTISFDLARTLTLYGGAMIGAAPSTVIPRLDLDVTVANFVTTPERAQRIVGVVIRSRLFFFGPGSYRSSDTQTDMIGFGAAFGICVTPHYDSGGLVLLVCADAGLGDMSLRTTGAGGAPIQSKFLSFGLVSLQLEALYNLTSVVNVGIKLGGDAYPGSPSWSAERADGTRIFAQSGYSAYLLAGIGFRF